MSPGVDGPGSPGGRPAGPAAAAPPKLRITGTYCSEGPETGQSSANSWNGGINPVCTLPTVTAGEPAELPSSAQRSSACAMTSGPAVVVGAAGAAGVEDVA